MTATCPTCGLHLPEGSASCPRCLLGLAIDAPTARFVNEDFRAPRPEELSVAFPQLEVQQLIGQGGMGAVYRARHRVLDRVVALKILPPHLADRPDFAARFEREARALARLSHPNIVGVFDSGKAAGYYFLVMEFVDGVNLRQAIQAGAIRPAEALTIVPQICEALQYAHDQGIVHRDIKPENILLDRQGRVRVADFGLARMLDIDQISDTLTASRQVMGTPRYMAPEQLEGSHGVDHRADIYSLGVVFYELLTGELPLGRFPAPSQGGAIDRRLDQIVFRTLEKRPDARYQQANQLKTDVETVSHSPRRALPASNRFAFREYRSRTTVMGLPFFHYANGIDPRTGRGAVAKGVVAIGPRAIGALAIGGQALGIVAIGGISIGVFSIGGVCLGLMMALGGISISTLFAAGGVAVGFVAVGGASAGVAALGGAAIGPYYSGGLGQTPPPPEFIFPGLIIVSSLAFGLFWPVLFFTFVLALLLNWSNPRPHVPPVIPAATPGKPPRVNATSPWKFTLYILGGLFAGLIGMGLLIALILSLFTPTHVQVLPYGTDMIPMQRTAPYPGLSGEQISDSVIVRTIDGVEVPRHVRSNVRDWVDVQYDEDGPMLSPELVSRLWLTNQQRESIDDILERFSKASLEIEEARSVVRSVNSYPPLVGAHDVSSEGLIVPVGVNVEIEILQGGNEEFKLLERAMWGEIDALTDPAQQSILHQEIFALPAAASHQAYQSMGTYLQPGAFPSILGWGGVGGRISVSRTENAYSWRLDHAGSNVSGAGDTLPPEIMRYRSLIEKAVDSHLGRNQESEEPKTEEQADEQTDESTAAPDALFPSVPPVNPEAPSSPAASPEESPATPENTEPSTAPSDPAEPKPSDPPVSDPADPAAPAAPSPSGTPGEEPSR